MQKIKIFNLLQQYFRYMHKINFIVKVFAYHAQLTFILNLGCHMLTYNRNFNLIRFDVWGIQLTDYDLFLGYYISYLSSYCSIYLEYFLRPWPPSRVKVDQ